MSRSDDSAHHGWWNTLTSALGSTDAKPDQQPRAETGERYDEGQDQAGYDGPRQEDSVQEKERAVHHNSPAHDRESEDAGTFGFSQDIGTGYIVTSLNRLASCREKQRPNGLPRVQHICTWYADAQSHDDVRLLEWLKLLLQANRNLWSTFRRSTISLIP